MLTMGFSSGAGDGDRDTHPLHSGGCVQRFLKQSPLLRGGEANSPPGCCLISANRLPMQHFERKRELCPVHQGLFSLCLVTDHINNLQCLRKLSQIFDRLSHAHCAGQRPHLGHSVVEERKQNTDIPDWPTTAHQPSQFSVLPPRAGVQVPR